MFVRTIRSPVAVFTIVLGIVFSTELVIMMALSRFPLTGVAEWAVILLDALALTAVAGPLAWVVLIDPLKRAAESEEARFGTLFGAAGDAVIAMDERGVVTLFNPAAEELFGYSAGEVVGRSASILMPEAFPLRHGESVSRFLRTGDESVGGAGALEIPCLRKDGSIVSGELTLRGTEVGGQVEYIGVLRDISARRIAEDALRGERERFRNFFENLPIGAYRTTPDGRILAANAALVKMLGWADVETYLRLNVDADLYVDVEDRRRWQAAIERDGVVMDDVAAVRRRDGSTIWVRDTARAIRDESGRIEHYEGTWEDVSEQKRNREAVESLARFPGENPHPILRVAAGGALLYANEASRPLLDLWSLEPGGQMPPEVAAKAREALESGEARDTEIPCGDRTYHFTFAPFPDLGYLNLYGHNVTELERTLRELRDAVAHVKRLQGIIPMCAFCKRIRDDREVWHQLESYIKEHSEALISHALCQDCLREHYPDLAD